MRKLIIAIDGYSSCGKSTLARQLAEMLHYVYVDSGAMYRAITLYFLQNNIDWHNVQNVTDVLQNIHLAFIYNPNIFRSEIYMNDENVELQVRDMIVAEKVSEVATIKPVRDFAVAQQQKMGAQKKIVMDGRDIGTVVFPDADLKIFMIADMAVRVQRRYKELYEKNKNISLDEVKENLALRDYIDSTRAISPLRKAEDAIVLDNTNMTMQQQLQFALDKISLLQKALV